MKDLHVSKLDKLEYVIDGMMRMGMMPNSGNLSKGSRRAFLGCGLTSIEKNEGKTVPLDEVEARLKRRRQAKQTE